MLKLKLKMSKDIFLIDRLFFLKKTMLSSINRLNLFKNILDKNL